MASKLYDFPHMWLG